MLPENLPPIDRQLSTVQVECAVKRRVGSDVVAAQFNGVSIRGT